jgi:hypothetical protein
MNVIITSGEVADNHMRSFTKVMDMKSSEIIPIAAIYDAVPEAPEIAEYNYATGVPYMDKKYAGIFTSHLKDEYGYTPKTDNMVFVEELSNPPSPEEKLSHVMNRILGHVAVWEYIPMDINGLKPAHVLQKNIIDEKIGDEIILSRKVYLSRYVTLEEVRQRSIATELTSDFTPIDIVTTYEKGFMPDLTKRAVVELNDIVKSSNEGYAMNPEMFDMGLEQDPGSNLVRRKLKVYDSLG